MTHEEFGEKYPQHRKVKSLSGELRTIAEFIDWLHEQKYRICSYDPNRYEGEYFPVLTFVDMLAEYFDIDMNKFEEEKRAMLKERRKENK